MVLASHNSWTYLKPKKCWQKLISFTARCQKCNIKEQYTKYGVRCFDLRIRFKKGNFIMAHGSVEYKYSRKELYQDLFWLDDIAKRTDETIYIRVLNEVRSEKDHNYIELENFRQVCSEMEEKFSNLYFWCGRNLCGEWELDYKFQKSDPSCEEKYSSVMKPRLIDDWFPLIYAKLNNKKIVKEGTDKDILMIDFVNIQ